MLRAKHLLVVLFWCKGTNIWSVFVSMSVSTKDLQLSIFHYFSFNLHSTMNPSGGWRCTFIVMQQVHMVFVIHSNVPLHSRWQISYHQLATNQRPRDTSDIVHLAACMVQASLTGGQSLLPLVDNTNTTFLHSRFWLASTAAGNNLQIEKYTPQHSTLPPKSRVPASTFHLRFQPQSEKDNMNSIDQL